MRTAEIVTTIGADDTGGGNQVIRRLFGNRIAKFEPEVVTSINRAAECDPRDVGLAAHDVDAIWAAVVALYRTRMHPAISLCVRRRGKVVIDRAIGHVRGNAPGDGPEVAKVPATQATLFNLFSASKALTAMLMHLLAERRLVDLDRPVAEYIPEFARNDKGAITVRHVLTHRAGIPSIRKGNETLDLLADHARILALLCDARPASRPGHRLAYHAMTGGYLCAEIVRRVTGRGIREFFADDVLRPLGFQNLNYGVAASDLPRVAEDVFAGPPPPPPIDWLFRRALGVGWDEAPRLASDPRFRTAVIPSGNVIGTANEASRFFELLLRGGSLDGVRVFAPETVRRATVETSNLEIDTTLGFPVRYGTGFMLGRNRMSMYGPQTPHAFGHLGFTATVAWADPERDVAACLMTTGKTCVAPGWLDWYEVLSRIARHCAPNSSAR